MELAGIGALEWAAPATVVVTTNTSKKQQVLPSAADVDATCIATFVKIASRV